MSNVMSYKGYHAKVQYDAADEVSSASSRALRTVSPSMAIV